MRQGYEQVDPILMATVIQAYKFALDPSPAQRRALASHCGAARFAFNWGLARVRQRLDERKYDPSIEVPWTLSALRREWNRAKYEVAPWWAKTPRKRTRRAWTGWRGR